MSRNVQLISKSSAKNRFRANFVFEITKIKFALSGLPDSQLFNFRRKIQTQVFNRYFNYPIEFVSV